MAIDRTRLRWNGWGPLDAEDPLAHREGAWAFIADALGAETLPATPAAPFEETRVSAPLDDDAMAPFAAIVGAENVLVAPLDRARRARGRSYPDLLALRAGDASNAPGAVVLPGSAEEALAVLQSAEAAGLPVVPFGGGTSVVGGVAGGGRRSIALDMTRMTRLIDLSADDRLATFEAGIDGPALEAALGERGFVLGHAPQSFLHSTLGGWIAASGAGQQSNLYGRAGDWFVAAELATPEGLWRTERFPANAAGPALGRLVVGSEGALGIIVSATVRIRPQPAVHDYRGYVFRDFAAGARAIQDIVQAGVSAATLRLSDADETRFYAAFAALGAAPSPTRALARAYLKWRGVGENFCMLIAGFEGEAEEVRDARRAAVARIARAGGIAAGKKYGERWREGRFQGPLLRDPLLDRGVGVDTLETACRWSKLSALHAAVRTALHEAIAKEAPGKGAVMAHVSHSYPEGASLYFTFLFQRRAGDELRQWQAIKRAASEAIIANGGTITHHHGVGTDHLPWMAAEKGELALDILKAVKGAVDPRGILNPGKLIPP